jgi:glutathione S-transferase
MWLLEEMGLEYELRDAFDKPGDPPTEEIRRLNPNAKVPVLESGDFVMWESLAINLHATLHRRPRPAGPACCSGPSGPPPSSSHGSSR